MTYYYLMILLATGGFSDPWGDNSGVIDAPPPVYATVNKSKRTNDPWATPTTVTDDQPSHELFSPDPPPSDFVTTTATTTMDPWGSSVTASQPPAKNNE